MIVKGRPRGNGAQLANYLLHSPENQYSLLLLIKGCLTNGNVRQALLEMSLTSEITGKTKNGLYHMQLNPRINEAEGLTFEQKIKMVEITAKAMGLEDHKYLVVEQMIGGRVHFHVGFERYNHDTGLIWSHKDNYEKHNIAARAIEREFGWELTHENKNVLAKDIKDHIVDLWCKHEPTDFIKAMGKSGFEVVQGIDKRPYKIVDKYGNVHDLSRQLAGFTQKHIAQELNPIRKTLRQEGVVSQEKRAKYQREIKEQEASRKSDKSREMSDVQQAAIDRINKFKERHKTRQQPKLPSYGVSFSQPLNTVPSYNYSTPSREEVAKVSEKKSDFLDEMSDKQDLAAAMIDYQKAKDQTPINENSILDRFRYDPTKDKLAHLRYDPEKDPLAKFRENGQDKTRPKERTRERGHDIE